MGQKHNMIRKTLLTVISTALLSLLIQLPSHAGVYKWVDENGQVHYGEQPGNNNAAKVEIRNNETTKARAIKTDEDGKNTKPKDENTTQAEAEPAQPVEPEKPSISKKEKRRLCQQAKNDYATISSRGRMREINKKGEYIYLDEKQRQQRLAAAKKKQQKYCR